MKNKEYLVVKASAGTGKTYRLSLEYIYSLCMGTDYKNILVMTFTKKATSEIKIEVLSKVSKFVEIYDYIKDSNKTVQEELNSNMTIDEKKKEEYLSLIKNLENLDKSKKLLINKAVLKKLSLIYNEILKNKEKLRIYTIDAFINVIFKNLATNILKIKQYSMIDEEENEKYYKLVLEEVFANKKVFSEYKEFFKDNAEKNIDNFLSIMKKLISERWKYLFSLDRNGNYIVKEKFNDNTDIVKIFHEAIKYIKDEKNTGKLYEEKFVSSSLTGALSLSDDEIEDDLLKIENLEKIVGSANLYDGRYCFKGKEQEKLYMAELKEKLEEGIAKELFDKLVIPYEERIIDLCKNIYKIYDYHKMRDRKFTFNDISTYTYMTLFDETNSFIDNDGLKDEFYEALDMKIDTVFIDEFQDTSVLQWKMLYEIIKKANRAICVGDDKQSIYGWRDGEKRLFENLGNILGTEPESLNISYRSDKNIVDYTNNYFMKKKVENDWKFEPITANSKKEGFVKKIEIICNGSDEKIIYKTLIDEIKKYNSYEDVAIISRKNETLKEIASVLEDEKIPYIRSGSNNLDEYKGIYECCELINYLVCGTELSLYNFLSSEISEIGTNELKKLLTNKNALISYILLEDENKIIQNSINKKIIEYLDKIKYFKKNYKSLSIQDLIYEIIEKFKIIDYFNKEKEIKNISEFYLLSSKYNSLIDLLNDYKNNKISLSEEKEKQGIELITIHKSKGLQYKTVFFININGSQKNGFSKNEGFLFEMNSKYDDIDFSLFYKPKYRKIVEKCFPNVVERYNKKYEEEEINNLYVALTRAKNNMIIIDTTIKIERKNAKEKIETSIETKELIGEFSETYVKNLSSLEAVEEKNEILDLENMVNIFKEKVKIEEKRIEINRSKFLLETEEKRMIGLLIHSFFENIKYAEESEIEYSKALCYKEYLSYFGEEKMNIIFSKENINKYLETDTKIFSKDWDYIYSEYEVYDLENQKEYRIDRLMIRGPRENEKGKVYIVDYKTGRINETQLITYRDVLLKKFPELKDYDIELKYIEFNL